MKRNLVFSFLIGAIVFAIVLGNVSAIPCSDTDGNNIKVFGTVSNLFGSYDDYCYNSNVVVEYTCGASGYAESNNHNCNNLDEYSSNYCNVEGNSSSVYRNFLDYYCGSGRCKYTSTPELVEECEYGCTDGECDPIPDSCQDTDGSNIWIFGTTSGYLDEFPYSNEDYCVDTENVIEYTCNGDYSQSNQQSCGTDGYTGNYCGNSTNNVYKDYRDYFCSAGKCDYTSTPELVEECEYGCTDGECNAFNYCTDSDGNNIWVLGLVIGNFEGDPFQNEDYCVDTENVMEYFCLGSFALTQQNYCGTDGYSGNYCGNSTNTVYRNFIDYSCGSGKCDYTSTPELVEECEYECIDGECN